MYRLRLFIIILTLSSFSLLQAQTQRGRASYYSKRATGAHTASGARLHHDSLTCAHRTYPFGTLLKVTNPANNKSVIVKVTDRGPFGRGRIIDLSWRAAKELDILTQGVAMVKVELYRDANGIPYRPEGSMEFPEMDFEMSEAGYSFIENWKQRTEEADRKITQHKRKPTAKRPTSKQQAAAEQKANKKTDTEDTESNVWLEVFNKVKNLTK